MKRLPNMAAPCANCPFRKDSLKGWLGRDRMTEILNSSTFVCHKDNTLQCAGHMLIKEDGNEFVRLAEQMDITLKLSGRDKVFETEQECVDHHGK